MFKNFGLYRERTGALFVLASNHLQADIAATNLFSLTRANYSMRPDHGASIVKVILQNSSVCRVWRNELKAMRERIISIRDALAITLIPINERYEFLRRQAGMFSVLSLKPHQIEVLKNKHGVYLSSSGRINVTGLNDKSIIQFGYALKQVFEET